MSPHSSPVRAGDVEGRCSGDWTAGIIVDQIGIPDVPPGDYVVGFRWDCEETTQVWSGYRGALDLWCKFTPHLRCALLTSSLAMAAPV